MICKVYDVDPLICPSCGGQMRIISYIEDPEVIDRIITHLKLSFQAERPPPCPAGTHPTVGPAGYHHGDFNNQTAV